MNGFLLDTNILSEFARHGSADPAVKAWLTNTDDSTLFVSVIVLAEIRRGIERLDQGKRRSGLQRWYQQELIPSFGERILPVSRAIAERWAILSARLERQGKTQPIFDGLIAATALDQGLTVVTRNVDDFKSFGLLILNPWQSGEI